MENIYCLGFIGVQWTRGRGVAGSDDAGLAQRPALDDQPVAQALEVARDETAVEERNQGDVILNSNQ